jgi:beta-mannosidase
MKTFARFCAAMVCGGALSAGAEVTTSTWRLDLAGTWSLRQADGKDAAIPMTVPGGVHTALLNAKKIPDPFFGQNEKIVQWVGQKDWIAERTFTVPAELLARKSVCLRLEDVDTFCTLSINGKAVGETGNRFRRYEFEVKPLLKAGENKISGYFHSSEKMSEDLAAKLTHPIPMVDNGLVPHINLVRKPACHGGWDWGLSLMVTGFAGKTELLGTDIARMDYVMCEQKHSPDRCDVTVHAEVSSPEGGATTMTVELGGQKTEQAVTLKPGKNGLTAAITVSNPRLWWPNGSGEQALYDLKVTVGEASLSRKLGLRRIEIINKPDWDGNGASMTFRVNGVDTFCKGADWIPCDAFQNRQTPERFRDLLTSAKQANMNIVRLWGGGQFENDAFYEACDELGLMIWHDFMFSCALYPADKAFLGEVRAELNHQLRRLRDHASIALWCGDNECLGAIGWFEPSRKNRDTYVVAYDRLNRMMTDLVAELDPTRTFWPSSPCGGPGDFSDGWHDDSKGDMHYWSVWHENKDFSAYYDVKPRFCSEFGFQSFSSPEVAATYCKPEQMNPTAPDFEYHQKNRGGNGRILGTMTRYFRFPVGIDNVLYLSQVQQAMAIKTAVEGWRRLQPRCMGTIFWQLNDNWPVASWSSVEYGGKWKHLQYHAKRFYAPLAILAAPADNNRTNIEVWAVNDYDQSVSANAEVGLWNFSGKTISRQTISASLPPRSASLLRTFRPEEFGTDSQRLERFLSLEISANVAGKKVTHRNEWMFNYYKTCELADANVDAAAAQKGNVFTVTLSTDKPAFFVWANATGIRGEFNDNSFTLYPGKPVTLTFTPKQPVTLDQFKAALSVKHLRQTY